MVGEDRKINWQKITLAFLIAVFMFTFGLFIGFLAKTLIQGATIDLQNSVRNEIVNLETIDLLEKDNVCENYSINLISEKLDYTGELISLLEIKKGKADTEVLELKKLYTMLEVRHMLLMEEKNRLCDQDYDIFLFFYSNDENCEDDVEKTSFILSYLRKKYENVRVYSFDSNLDSDLVKILMSKYSVNSCKVVILNGEKVTKDIARSEDLEELFVK